MVMYLYWRPMDYGMSPQTKRQWMLSLNLYLSFLLRICKGSNTGKKIIDKGILKVIVVKYPKRYITRWYCVNVNTSWSKVHEFESNLGSDEITLFLPVVTTMEIVSVGELLWELVLASKTTSIFNAFFCICHLVMIFKPLKGN